MASHGVQGPKVRTSEEVLRISYGFDPDLQVTMRLVTPNVVLIPLLQIMTFRCVPQ